MLRLSFSLPIETADNDGLKNHAQKLLGLNERDIISLSPFKRSLDARKGRPFLYVWTVDITLTDIKKEKLIFNERKNQIPNLEYIEKELLYSFPLTSFEIKTRPVIAGFGPAGIFCALMLARAGAYPIILERGGSVNERVMAVDTFFKDKKLDENCNIQFGEGGAGTFSDGKLNTLVKDKNYRGYFVLQEFVRAGAPDDILYINKPHIGTDRLREVVKNIRKEIISLGGEVLFNTRLTDIIIKNGSLTGVFYESNGKQSEIKTDTLFLGTGHSARDIFTILNNKSVPLERKPFSVGVRIEHLQSEIDKTQYRNYAGSPYLPSSDYKLVYHTKNGRTLYSFCMCPGGIVIAAASENGGIVTNGMSYHARDGINANSALLVTVQPQDLPDDSLFAGVELQKQLEKKAFLFGDGDFKAPCQCVGDFLQGKATTTFGIVKPSYPCGVLGSDLNKLLPGFITETLRDGLISMDTLLKGFADPEAVLTAPESRSTSPIRIIRGEDMQSSIKGLFPIGEGAGYAGGIMSAAIDGIKAAECYCENI
ncbi:MAG: hypothetical protein A2Y15_05000 [Clostridiales bacterium GWF2_36_10]|nr:MAG: hypothetical protein A2Y15_05000 [Clostridiales bacterium GWF2_36_10]